MLKAINVTAIIAFLFASCSAPVLAQGNNRAPATSTAADRSNVEVTVYNSDLGLVKERRTINTAAGGGELRFMDVPMRINPVTVHVRPIGRNADFTILEQNYEYDLISHAKLMDKYVGEKIKIMEWNQFQDRREIVEAEVLSGSSAAGEVYRIGNEIYLGHPGIKILPELPENLISRPTLSWIYNSRSARAQEIEVSYLTAGMSWNADYILVLNNAATRADLSGWVTVRNQSGAEFEDARLKLIAGNVNIAPQEPRALRSPRAAMAMADEAAVAGFAQSEVFEYHMYDLQRQTTIKNNQTKQISLMSAQGVRTVQEYVTTASPFMNPGRGDIAGEPVKQPVTAFIKFKNSKDNGLGDPLPGGTVRLYTADANERQQFIGEDRIAHTPRDEEIRLRVGEAFDIVAERTHISYNQISSQMHESEFRITLRNRKRENVTVSVIENAYGTWSITESSHNHTKVNATTFRFDVPVAAGRTVTVSYKIRTGI